MALIRLRGVVEVTIYDASHGSIDYLALLRRAGQFGLVRAVILFDEINSESYRKIEQIAFLSGLDLLAALRKPVQLTALQKALRRYNGRWPLNYAIEKSFTSSRVKAMFIADSL
jgi:hypothetical protein